MTMNDPKAKTVDAKAKTVDGFWWCWVEGHDWPTWQYGELAAERAANEAVRRYAGRNVYFGRLAPKSKLLLPDKLEVTDFPTENKS
jgi:hypothetical protein